MARKKENPNSLEKTCAKCAKLGISYAELQRMEWLEEEKKRKQLLEEAKERELDRQMESGVFNYGNAQ